jgi:16S rRNA (adenine1518-N6/adenine1519-N6)-dimethyltransferase
VEDAPALLTPTAARALMVRYGLAMRRRDGQNLLVDPNTVRRIVAAADLHPDDVVLEVGPGLGSLTLGLAPAVARLVAVELDAGFVTALGDVLAGLGNVELHHADALDVDLGALVGGGPARLVSNLPYGVATAIAVTALEGGAFTDLFVMVQREVGERWAAAPATPAYGAVSVRLQVLAEVRVALTVPRAVFLPVPNVDSVMVSLRRRTDAPDPVRYARLSRLVELAFARRRKTLRNALGAALDPGAVATALAAVGVDPGERAERLDPPTLLALSDALGPALDGAVRGAVGGALGPPRRPSRSRGPSPGR